MDAVALASVITSGVVGVAGLAVAWSTAAKSREQAADLVSDSRDQGRRQEAYVDTLAQAVEVANCVSSAEDGVPRAELTTMLDQADPVRIQARLEAFASQMVLDAWYAWDDAARLVVADVSQNLVAGVREFDSDLIENMTILRIHMINLIAAELRTRYSNPILRQLSPAQMLMIMKDPPNDVDET